MGYALSPTARADLESIWDYTIAHWGEAQAEDYTRNIQAALIERLGGRAHVIEMAKTGATPTPGKYADDGY